MNDAHRLLDRFYDLIRQEAEQLYLTALPWASPCALQSQWEVSESRLPLHARRDDTVAALAQNLSLHFERSNKLVYLTEAISLNREALSLRELGHPQLGTDFQNLGACLLQKYLWHGTKDVADLTEAICLYQRALDLCPLGHRHHDQVLHQIAKCMKYRFYQTRVAADITGAIRILEEVLEIRPPGHPRRSEALVQLAKCLISHFSFTQHQQ